MRLVVILLLSLCLAIPVFAQEPTPTPAPLTHAMIDGQQTRFDYIVRAGQVHIALLLTTLIITVWAFFLFGIYVFTSLYLRRM